MHKFARLLSVTIALAGVAACNGRDPSQPEPPTPQASGVIPQAQLDALDKAKNVEAVLQQGAKRSDPAE